MTKPDKKITFIRLPEVDEYGTPKEKLPDCPHCGEDELAMLAIYGGDAFCYSCCSVFENEA